MAASPYLGLLLVIVATVASAAMNISIKMSAPWVTIWQSGAGRFALGLLILPFLVRLFKSELRFREHGWLFIRSLTGVTAFMLIVAALETAPLSQTLVLYYINPAACALIAPLMVGERTPADHWPLIIGAFIGVIIILAPFGHGLELKTGHILALASGLIASLTMLATRRAVRTNTAWTIYFHVCAVGFIGCLVPIIANSGPYAPLAWQGWLGLVITGLTAQVTMNASLAHLQTHLVAVTLSLEAAIAALFGVLALGEPVTWNLAIGGVMILGCGLLLNLRRRH